jgi:hypothetical protein
LPITAGLAYLSFCGFAFLPVWLATMTTTGDVRAYVG